MDIEEEAYEFGMRFPDVTDRMVLDHVNFVCDTDITFGSPLFNKIIDAYERGIKSGDA